MTGLSRKLNALSGPMEACSTFPHRGRVALAAGHEVRPIAPTCASRSRARENAAAAAEAIATAVRQPGMRFVEPKSLDRRAAAILSRRSGSSCRPAQG